MKVPCQNGSRSHVKLIVRNVFPLRYDSFASHIQITRTTLERLVNSSLPRYTPFPPQTDLSFNFNRCRGFVVFSSMRCVCVGSVERAIA